MKFVIALVEVCMVVALGVNTNGISFQVASNLNASDIVQSKLSIW